MKEKVWKPWLLIAVSLCFVALFLSPLPQAEALSGNCTAHLVNSVGYTHATGMCRSLGSDTKAQTVMVVAGGVDRTGGWWTDTNKWHNTGAWTNNGGVFNGWPTAAKVNLGLR
ncbi:hypothetical protein G1C95_0398 [Bifidobacterium sp. DSM 109957]|uniref:Uncharacterized protein n=1 Tax=Bifidobacterium oedipodis TaxID=2675322 RepID=A0A7Y0HS51_9BIFI|nr:hypothetical protein [Bifidobacterium sp. DSM 109957]